MWRQRNLDSNSKNTGILIRVTGRFNESVDRIIDKSTFASELKSKGYSIDKTVLGRFGYLLVSQNMELLSKYPNLLLAASKIESSEESILTIEKGVKK